MAIQKVKRSKSRIRRRRANYLKVKKTPLSICPQCGQLTRPHRVCSNCGYYNKRKVKTIK